MARKIRHGRYQRTTMSIPVAVYREMKAHEKLCPDTNWSDIATKAFAAECGIDPPLTIEERPLRIEQRLDQGKDH